MANGQLITTIGRKVAMHRIFDASPAYTAPSAFKVGTGTNTPGLGDIDLQTAITIGGSASKAISSGYPTFDDANMIITNRAILLTTECNGNTISEFGLINSDGTPVLFSRAVFTGISKTSSVQVIFKQVDVLE